MIGGRLDDLDDGAGAQDEDPGVLGEGPGPQDEDPAARDAAATTPARRRRESIGQTIGGVLFGFEQQVLRTTPPPQELVHHARPDAPIPARDGSLIHVGMPGVDLPDEPEP